MSETSSEACPIFDRRQLPNSLFRVADFPVGLDTVAALKKAKKTKSVITDGELAKVRDALVGKQEALVMFERLLEHRDDLQQLLDSFRTPLVPTRVSFQTTAQASERRLRLASKDRASQRRTGVLVIGALWGSIKRIATRGQGAI